MKFLKMLMLGLGSFLVLWVISDSAVFAKVKMKNVTEESDETSAESGYNQVGYNQGFDEKIKKLARKIAPDVNIGMVVLPLNSSLIEGGQVKKGAHKAEPFYARNENRLFTLASTTKVFTVVSALLKLGPDFQFKTGVYYAQTEDGRHNLYVKFDGDPTLDSASMRGLLAKADAALTAPVKFNKIYIVSSKHQFSQHAPGWMVGDTAYCYAPPVTSLILDRNCIDLESNEQFAIARKAQIDYTVSGQRRTPGSLDFYIEQKLKNMTKKHKKLSDVPIAFGHLPETAQLVAEVSSDPLEKILFPILKKSDNLPSDALFQKMGELSGQSEWGPAGESEVHYLQHELGVNLRGAVITDGSGLSRYNASSPMQFARLLEQAYYNDSVRPYFVPALAKLGVDGSLRNRHQKTSLTGLFKAKTGTMTGVVTLGGYLTVSPNKTYVVVMFFNNVTGKTAVYKRLQDQILEAVYQELS